MLNLKNLFEFKKGDVSAIHLIDSTMIIFNNLNKSGFYFYNYSLNSGKLIKEYLGKGRGPGEALGGFFSGIHGNSLWLFDITLKKILTIDTKNVLSNASMNFNEYRIKDNYYMISLVDSLRFFSVGNLKSSSKISNIDLISGEKINDYGSFYKIPDNLSLSGVKDAYTPYIFSKPSGSKVVLAYRQADIIEIYDEKSNTNIAIQGLEKFKADFTIRTRNGHDYMGHTKKSRMAFVNGAVTDKYIYLLYSGSSITDENPYYGKYVYIYDWYGKPVKKLTLDKTVFTIGISKNDKTLYSSDLETGYIMEANIN